jgi:hypothetical protein
MSVPTGTDHERVGLAVARLLLEAARERMRRERESQSQPAAPEPQRPAA